MKTHNSLQTRFDSKLDKEEFDNFKSSITQKTVFSVYETFTTDNDGDLTGFSVIWMANTSEQSSIRTLDPYGKRLIVRDYSGFASENNITIVAPSGQTIEGKQEYIIDEDNFCGTFYREGNNWYLISLSIIE